MNSFELVNRVCAKLDEKVEKSGMASLTPEERIVWFVWSALGILGNGSFQYFFENDLDPEATACCFQEIGLSNAAECFRLADSLLPAEYSKAEWKRQLEMLQQLEVSLDTLARAVLSEEKQAEARLEQHILARPKLKSLITE